MSNVATTEPLPPTQCNDESLYNRNINYKEPADAPINTITTSIPFVELYESFKEAESTFNPLEIGGVEPVNGNLHESQSKAPEGPDSGPKELVPVASDCPVHNPGTGSKTAVWIKAIWHGLKVSAAISYVLCPPFPCWIFHKAAFQPPPKTVYYYLIGEQDGVRRAYFNAEEAKKSGKELSLCLPHLLSPKNRCYDVLLQLLRLKVDIVKSREDHYLCVLLCECEKSLRRMKPLGVKRSPQLIIFSQPNSSDLGSCMLTDPNFPDMADFLQCDFLAYDYSGFGVSTGGTSEKSIYADIDAVWEYATETLNYAAQDIILIGFSIGTAAACYLAAQHPEIRGLVLLAPFTSFLRVLGRNPRLRRSCRWDKFSSFDRASSIRAKTLICHGTEDMIVRVEHGIEMSKRIPNAGDPVIVKASHQGIFCDRSMWNEVRRFVLEGLGVHQEWEHALFSVSGDKEPNDPNPACIPDSTQGVLNAQYSDDNLPFDLAPPTSFCPAYFSAPPDLKDQFETKL